MSCNVINIIRHREYMMEVMRPYGKYVYSRIYVFVIKCLPVSLTVTYNISRRTAL